MLARVSEKRPSTLAPIAPNRDLDAAPVRWWRIAALAALVVGLVVIGRATGATAYLSTERIRSALTSAGSFGPLLFLLVFAVGELVHVPGMVFVAASVIAYGRVGGGALALVGAIVSVSVSFFVVRAAFGKPLGAIRWRFARRILAQLDGHPVRTIVVLRLILWMTPQLNYALALSNVRYRSYLIGSAVGLVAPIVGIALLFDRFFN
jgi:uncharacterized membrane protein YdjX (TVP38/TMEM64 family)